MAPSARQCLMETKITVFEFHTLFTRSGPYFLCNSCPKDKESTESDEFCWHWLYKDQQYGSNSKDNATKPVPKLLSREDYALMLEYVFEEGHSDIQQ